MLTFRRRLSSLNYRDENEKKNYLLSILPNFHSNYAQLDRSLHFTFLSRENRGKEIIDTENRRSEREREMARSSTYLKMKKREKSKKQRGKEFLSIFGIELLIF
jgi:hypothetical protein